AVEVSRFSSGAWLEDQDFWRMGGIIREVALTAIPDLHIRDIEVKTDLDITYTNAGAEVCILLDGADDGEICWTLADGRIRMTVLLKRKKRKLWQEGSKFMTAGRRFRLRFRRQNFGAPNFPTFTDSF